MADAKNSTKYFIYIIRSTDPKDCHVKIGKAQNPFKRMANLQTASAKKLVLIHACPCLSSLHAYHMESGIHQEFRDYRIQGEWFNSKVVKLMKSLSGRTDPVKVQDAFSSYPSVMYFISNRYKGTPLDVAEQLKAALGQTQESYV